MVKQLLTEALDLSVAERIELAQYLWDSVAEIPDSFQLSQEQRAELVQRLESHRLNPQNVIDWEQVKSQIKL
jgi:putative addiction module component (TIGR02574 family)